TRARPQSGVVGYVNGSTEWFLMDEEKESFWEEDEEEEDEDTLTLRDVEDWEARESMQREREREHDLV
ncbi:MAG: hypothetical protein Q9212_004979, partial [Teloschistes hypoglaucus]